MVSSVHGGGGGEGCSEWGGREGYRYGGRRRGVMGARGGEGKGCGGYGCEGKGGSEVVDECKMKSYYSGSTRYAPM